MRVFYEKKIIEKSNLKKKIYIIFDSLLLTFFMCVFGIILFIKEYDAKGQNYYVEVLAQNQNMNITELQINKEQINDKIVFEYIKTRGGVDVFQEIFLEKMNKNGKNK